MIALSVNGVLSVPLAWPSRSQAIVTNRKLVDSVGLNEGTVAAIPAGVRYTAKTGFCTIFALSFLHAVCIVEALLLFTTFGPITSGIFMFSQVRLKSIIQIKHTCFLLSVIVSRLACPLVYGSEHSTGTWSLCNPLPW